MGRSKKSGIYPRQNGTYEVDTTYRNRRVRKSGFESYREAEDYLAAQKQRIKSVTTEGERLLVTLEVAASRYITEQAEKNLPSWENDASMLKPIIAMLGSLTIDQICDETLKPFVDFRKSQGRKAKTINHTLGSVRAICNLAASAWRFENGMTWLEKSPAITFVPERDRRPPRPLAWSEQPRLLHELPEHLRVMVLFGLNTGVRENVICSLRWAWEARVPISRDQTISVFVVPREHVKGRKTERIIVCNSAAQSIVDGQRGLHSEHVFCWPKPIGKGEKEYQPVQYINNNGWQKGRDRAGLSDLHVHDLRHTVGMRLRAAGVSERTQDAVLWHSKGEMTEHYAIAQIREIYNALELITRPADDFETLDLHALIRKTQARRFTEILPSIKKEPIRKIA